MGVPTPPQPDWWERTKQAADAASNVLSNVLVGGPLNAVMPRGVPVGEIAEKAAARGPDDPSRWFLNSLQDLGIVTAKTVQALTTPKNLALITLMAAGNPEAAVPVLANLGFSAEMAKDATESLSKGVAAAKKGDLREAGRLFGSAGMNALLIALGAKKGPKGATYQVSGDAPGAALQLPEAKLETPPAPKTSEVPLPKMQEGEIVTPKPPERRLNWEARQEYDAFKKAHPDITRAEYLQAVKDAHAEEAGKPVNPPYPKGKGIVPPPTDPVPPPPEIITQPKTVRSEGNPATVTPDDVKLYVQSKLSGQKFQVVGSDGEPQDLTDDASPEAQRVRDVKLTKDLHDELFPAGKYRAGMTVGQAVDAQPGQPHPETGRKYSSTQIDLPKPAADKVADLAKQIPESDLSGDGREDRPHVTVKYGLHGEDSKPLEDFLKGKPPITLTFGKTNYFPPSKGSEGNDVVIIGVDSPELHALNGEISGKFPVTDTHPEYKPHITLAYVKPGTGQKYAGNSSLEGQNVKADEITFSSRNGKESKIKLAGAALHPIPSPPAAQQPNPKPGGVPQAPSGGGVPAPPAVQPAPAKPQPEPGWKMSLQSYPKAEAEAHLKYRRNLVDEAKMVPDPTDKNRFWLTHKPKSAPVATSKSSPSAKVPPPSIPRWEWDDAAMLARLKETNGEMLKLVEAGKPVPPEMETEHRRLMARWRDIEEVREKEKTNAQKRNRP